MPRTGAPPTIGRQPDHRRRRRAQRIGDPGDREDHTDRNHRVAGREHHDVGGVDRLEDAWGRLGRLGDSSDVEAGRRDRGAQPDPPLLEVHGAPGPSGPAPSGWPSAARSTWVSVQSSVIGIRVTPGRQRSHSAAVAADSGCPAASMLVRTMCVAKSLSPRLNQSGPDQPEPAR